MGGSDTMANVRTTPHSFHGQEEKTLALGITLVDAFIESHVRTTTTLIHDVTNKTAANKVAKYSNISVKHLFVEIAIEIAEHATKLLAE